MNMMFRVVLIRFLRCWRAVGAQVTLTSVIVALHCGELLMVEQPADYTTIDTPSENTPDNLGKVGRGK